MPMHPSEFPLYYYDATNRAGSPETEDEPPRVRIWDNRRDYLEYGSEEAERQAWAPIHDPELRHIADELMGQLRDTMNNPASSDADKYVAAGNVLSSLEKLLERKHPKGFDIGPYAAMFDALVGYRDDTDKVLLKRVLEASIRFLPIQTGVLWYDSGLSAEEQDSIDAGFGATFPEATEVRFSEAATRLLGEHPEYHDFLEYGKAYYQRQRFGSNAGVGDWGYDDPFLEPAWKSQVVPLLAPLQASMGTTPQIVSYEGREVRYPDEILEEFDAAFGIQHGLLSERARAAIFPFCAGLTAEDLGRIRAVAAELDMVTERKQFAEAFLATEFGGALGESILTIAEKNSEDGRAFEVFQRIAAIREATAAWEEAAWFAQDSSEYRLYFDGIKLATDMRISQILSPVSDLLDGTPQQAQYFHRDGSMAEAVSIESIDQVLQGLGLLEFAIRTIARAEALPNAARRPVKGDDYWAAVTETGEAMVRTTMRPYEASGAEARIRWAVTLSPEQQLELFGRHLEYNKLGQPRSARVSLHVDLEKLSGKASFDFGTRLQYSTSQREYPDKLLAALVTAGVQHDAARAGQDITHKDYHVRDAFEPELSRPDYFAGFVAAAQEHYISPERLSLGSAGVRFSKLTSESERTSAVYTGLFLDEAAIAQLREKWPATLHNIVERPHVTIAFHPKTLEGFTPGEQHTVKVIGIIDNGRTQALVLKPSKATQGVMNPHITLSTGVNSAGKRIAPDYSKQAIKEGQGIEWFASPIGIPVTSGYLDSSTGQIVMHA